MKDEKARYLIVDAKEINKQLYKVYREFAFNDFDNIYEPHGMIDAREIFEKNGVPEKFQKILIKINIPFFIKTEAQEYTMGFPFDFTGGKIVKEDNKKIITAFNKPIYDYQANREFSDKIRIRTELVYSNFTDIINFLSQIEKEGHLSAYLQSIKDFFDIHINLDLLLQSWSESQKITKSEFPSSKKKSLKKYIKNNKK